VADDIRQSLELNAKQVLDELERLKTGFTSYNDRLGTTANRLDSVTESAKRTLSTLRDLRTEARLVEKAMGSIGTGTRSLGPATSGKVSGGALLGGKDASKAFDQFFTDCTKAQVVASKTGQTVSTAFDQIQRDAATKVVPAGKAVQASTESMWLSWQTFARVIQTQLFVRGMNAVRDAFTESASAAMEFSSNISNIRAINPERTFGEIAASVRTMSDSFNQSLETVSRAQLEVISDQFSDTADMVNILTAANKLAKATGEDLVPTAQLLTGALNAYGESADMAEVRAAQFFTTIDLGRLKSGELATALGRVQSIGNSVGAEMEELDAALAAITIGGVKANEASTQLRGILIGLLKPTEEMKKSLAKLGFDSGEVAVKALGLQRALQALIGTTDGATSSIAALFQNQRALAGVLRLVNTGADAYQKSLAGIYDTETAMLDSKLGERMQTDAERLTAATTQLKNFWTAEFGADVVEKLNTVIQLVGGGGGLVGAFRNVTSTAPAAIAVIGGLAAATARWGLAADVATAKFTKGVGLGLSKLGTLSNALAVFGAYEALSSAGDTIARKIASHWTGPMVFAREEMNRLLAEDQKQSSARLRTQQRANTDLIRLARQEVAEKNAGYLRDRQNYDDVAESHVATAKSAFDRVMQYRQRMESELRSSSQAAATKAFETIPNEIERLQRTYNDRQFQESLERNYAPDRQYTPLLNQFRERLRLARELQAAAKDTAQEERASEAWERVEAARQQVVAAASLTKSKSDDLSASKLLNEIDQERISALKQQAVLQEQLSTALETRANTAAKHTAELETIRASIESRLDTAVKTAEGGYRRKTADELTRDIALAEQEIVKFRSVLTKYGREDFASAFLGDAKAFASLRRQAIRELTSQDVQTISTTPQAIGKMHAELQASFDQMVLQVPIVAKLADYTGLDPRDVGIDAVLDRTKEMLDEADAARMKYTDGTKALLVANAAFEESLERAWSKLPAGEDLKGLDMLLVKLTQAKKDTELTAEEMAALTDLANRMDVTELFRVWRAGGLGSMGPKAGAEFSQSIASMLNALEQRSKAQAMLRDAGPQSDAYNREIAAIRSGLAELEKKRAAQQGSLQLLSVEAQGNQLVKTQLGEHRTAINEKLSAQRPVLDAIAAEAKGHDFIRTQIDSQNASLRTQLSLLQTITSSRSAAPNRAFGGWFAQGGTPRGLDTIPAMLSPGEFVVNASSARRFASQLIALNAGVQPTYRNEGGNVTNVGDIHVTVNGGGTSRQTAREIAVELRREIRRGTVRL
jgi:TP901 family phage tail tape measure protein